MNVNTKSCDGSDCSCGGDVKIPVLRNGVYPSCLPNKDQVDLYSRENGVLYYFDQYGVEHVVKGEGQISVVDDLDSDNPNIALSANQGRVLKELVDTKLDNYIENYEDSDILTGKFLLDSKISLFYGGGLLTSDLVLEEKNPVETNATTYLYYSNSTNNSFKITLPNTGNYEVFLDNIIWLAPNESVLICISGDNLKRKIRYNKKSESTLAYNGKKQVVLDKNVIAGVNTLASEMLRDSANVLLTNTDFIIKYDFILPGWIRVGDGCKFIFEGGSIHSDNASYLTNSSGTAQLDQTFFSYDLSNSNKKIETNVFRTTYLAGTNTNGGKIFTESKTGWINVTDYGIIGDGVTDNTAKLNALLNNANRCPPDSVVYFPRGIYKITDTILVYSTNVTLRGDSNGFDAESTLSVGDYEAAQTVYRGATVLFFDPTFTGTNQEKLMINRGTNNFRINYDSLTMVSKYWRATITEDYANGPATGPKHRTKHYEDATMLANNNTVSACFLYYGIMRNCNIFGFNGVGVYHGGYTSKIVSSRINHCHTGVKTYDKRLNQWITDSSFEDVYISRCYVGIHASFWIFAYGLWMDEIETYGILQDQPSSGGTTYDLKVEIVGGHFNHIDYAGIKSTSLNNSQIVSCFNRCGAYYAGYNFSQVPTADRDKCCQIYVTNQIELSQIDIKNTYARVGDIEATRGGYCIANNLTFSTLSKSQIKIAGTNESSMPYYATGTGILTDSTLQWNGRLYDFVNNVDINSILKSGTTAQLPSPSILNTIVDRNINGITYYDKDKRQLFIWNNGWNALNDEISVESFGAVGDGITNDYVAIQAAIEAARAKRTIVNFNNSKYFIGDNTVNVYTSIRLKFNCETRFIVRLTTDKPALLFNVDLNSNTDPKITEPLLIGRGLYIEGNTANRIGTGIEFNPISSILQASNLEVNNIKVQFFDRGLKLPASNFYINKFTNLHITQCNIDIDSYINSGNSGENIHFDFCVLGSAKIGLKSNGGITGYWFNNCSLDFLQCIYDCNGNMGQDMVTFHDCWVEGFNIDQGGDPIVHGLVYGNSFVAGARPHPNRVSFLNCKIVNNSKIASIGSVSDLLIETTDADIYFDNNVLTTTSVYDSASYDPTKLYSCSDNINIKVSNFRLSQRPQGNKLLHKSQDLLPLHITRLEAVDLFAAVNNSNSYAFGNTRVRGASGIDMINGASGQYLDIFKNDTATTASCIIEPNIDPVDIKHLKDLILFPSINVTASNINSIKIQYLVRYYNKEGELAAPSTSFKNFLFSDGISGGIDNITEFAPYGDIVPYAVKDYRWVDNTDIPNNAVYFIPSVRIQFTGEGAAEVRFNNFNLIDKKSELTLKPFNHLHSLTTIGASYIGKSGFYTDRPIIHNSSKWITYDGFTLATKAGTTAERPTSLNASDRGYIYYDTGINKPIIWTGGIWRETDGSGADSRKSGTTAQRPTVAANYIYVGYLYYDSTLRKTIQHIGSDAWIESDGATAGVLRYGTTVNRPISANIYNGFSYYDTTLGYEITWSGVSWRKSDGASVDAARQGSTAGRPTSTNIYVGYVYFDTTLNKLITWNGTKWIESDGSDAGVLRYGKISDLPDITSVPNGFIFTYADASGFSINMYGDWVEILV